MDAITCQNWFRIGSDTAITDQDCGLFLTCYCLEPNVLLQFYLSTSVVEKFGGNFFFSIFVSVMDAEPPGPVKKKKSYSGNFCQAPGCSNSSGKDKLLGIKRQYHRFPGKDPKTLSRRRQWLKAIPRENWSPKKNGRICSDHFIGGLF